MILTMQCSDDFGKYCFFIKIDESIADQPKDKTTEVRTDKASYRDVKTHLKVTGNYAD